MPRSTRRLPDVRRLRVAFDVTPRLIGSTGVARYVRELEGALDPTVVSLAPFAIGRTTRPPEQAVRHLRVPLRVVHASWRRFSRPRVEAIVGTVDVVHATDLLPPPAKAPVVLTVHDLLAVELPHLHPSRAVSVQNLQLDAARRADAVLADSQATAAVLVRNGVPLERVHVVPIGATRLPTATPDDTHDRYLLGVGALAARKGWEVLIDAFSRSRTPGVRLRIAGPDGFGAGAVRAAAERAGAEVELLGTVTDSELAQLYAGCIATCAPSWGEGFGLPVLEACAAGTPVVASDLAVFHEVAGDAALFVTPGDVDGWTRAIERIVDDGELRDRLRVLGPSVACRYSWDACARATEAVYRAVAAR